jgi:hypothetical protein
MNIKSGTQESISISVLDMEDNWGTGLNVEAMTKMMMMTMI